MREFSLFVLSHKNPGILCPEFCACVGGWGGMWGYVFEIVRQSHRISFIYVNFLLELLVEQQLHNLDVAVSSGNQEGRVTHLRAQARTPPPTTHRPPVPSRQE